MTRDILDKQGVDIKINKNIREKEIEVLVQRAAHDIVSPLSSLCMLAEMLDDLMYKKLLQMIKFVNLMKLSCLSNVEENELAEYYCLFHNMKVNDDVSAIDRANSAVIGSVSSRSDWLKHLMLWMYSKQNKQTEIVVNGTCVTIKNCALNEEEECLLNVVNGKEMNVECNYHNVYLVRFIEACSGRCECRVEKDGRIVITVIR